MLNHTKTENKKIDNQQEISHQKRLKNVLSEFLKSIYGIEDVKNLRETDKFINKIFKNTEDNSRHLTFQFVFRYLAYFHAVTGKFPNRDQLQLLLLRQFFAELEVFPKGKSLKNYSVEDFDALTVLYNDHKELFVQELDEKIFDQIIAEIKNYRALVSENQQTEKVEDGASLNVIKRKTESKRDDIFDQYWQLTASTTNELIFNSLNELEKQLSHKIETNRKIEKLKEGGKYPTLDLFPAAFKNLKIIVGGFSKITTLEHVGDLFREPQSMTNLHYLLKLKLDKSTEIITDQDIMDMSQQERCDILGQSHLLVIGKPSVNALNRELVLKKKLISSCILDVETYRWTASFNHDFYDYYSKHFDSPTEQQEFAVLFDMDDSELSDYLQNRRYEKKSLKIKDIEKMLSEINLIKTYLERPNIKTQGVIGRFSPKRFHSPFNKDIVEQSDGKSDEFAVIGLCKNDFAREDDSGFTIISVFGMDKISTAKALLALSHEDYLSKHPFGGILKVDLNKYPGFNEIKKSRYELTDEKSLKTLDEIQEQINNSKTLIFKKEKLVNEYNELKSKYEKLEANIIDKQAFGMRMHDISEEIETVIKKIPMCYRHFNSDAIERYGDTVATFFDSYRYTHGKNKSD